MARFDEELACVYNMYAHEPVDSTTLKHMNAYAQSKVPGPYRLVEGVNGEIYTQFDWISEAQRVWWTLKWL